MIYQSLYYLTDDSIVYPKTYTPGIQIPLLDFHMMAESRSGFYTSKAMNTLIDNPLSSLQAVYHLAAVHEKYLPSNWDWEVLLHFKEREHYEKTAGEQAYLITTGRFVRPEFYDDYGFDEYLGRIAEWAKERGQYKSDQEILDHTKRKIQELIIERSKSDFIELTDKQINLIHGLTAEPMI